MSNDATVTISEKTKFKDNTAKQGVIQISAGKVSISDSEFTDNYGYQVTNGFILTECDLTLESSTTISNSGKPYYTYDDIYLE